MDSNGSSREMARATVSPPMPESNIPMGAVALGRAEADSAAGNEAVVPGMSIGAPAPGAIHACSMPASHPASEPCGNR